MYRASHPLGLIAPVKWPSLKFKRRVHSENCARIEHWRTFQRVVTSSEPLVTTRLAQMNWRRNAGKFWRSV
jgi:hypothetical protein